MSVSVYTIALICVCAVGLLYCFRGYKNLRLFMVLYGLYTGYNWVMSMYGGLGGWMWILALGLGIVIALLAFLFMKFAIFLAGGLLGLLIYRAVLSANPLMFGGTSGSLVAGLVFFAIAGAITLALKRTLIIVGTSFYGAWTFTDALGILIGLLSAPTGFAGTVPLMEVTTALDRYSVYLTVSPAIPWVVTILLAVVGMVCQFRGGKSKRKGASTRSSI